MMLIIIVPILTLFGCLPQNNEHFDEYINQFSNIELPFSIDEGFLDAQQMDLLALDTHFVNLFIEKNIFHGGGITMFEVYVYFPLYKFQVNQDVLGVIVKKQGGAGGIEDLYYLFMYSKSGELLGSFLFSKQVGGCESIHVQLGSIKRNLEINTYSKILVNGCDSDEYVLKSEVFECHKIEYNGKIIKTQDCKY